MKLRSEQRTGWNGEAKMRRAFVIFGLLIVAMSPMVAAAQARGSSSGIRPISVRVCEPSLPVLYQSLPSPGTANGIRSCDVISSPLEWAAFCADHELSCTPYDDQFFSEWTMVAVVVDTVSPVICDNAGEVPGWALSCLTRRGGFIRARVELRLPGAECLCSMPPQYPVQLVIVDAVHAGPTTGCRAWTEVHRIECLRN
jgi:hypothetical protein